MKTKSLLIRMEPEQMKALNAAYKAYLTKRSGDTMITRSEFVRMVLLRGLEKL